MPSGVGSPEATPGLNGEAGKLGPAAPPGRSGVRRLMRVSQLPFIAAASRRAAGAASPNGVNLAPPAPVPEQVPAAGRPRQALRVRARDAVDVDPVVEGGD